MADFNPANKDALTIHHRSDEHGHIDLPYNFHPDDPDELHNDIPYFLRTHAWPNDWVHVFYGGKQVMYYFIPETNKVGTGFIHDLQLFAEHDADAAVTYLISQSEKGEKDIEQLIREGHATPVRTFLLENTGLNTWNDGGSTR